MCKIYKDVYYRIKRGARVIVLITVSPGFDYYLITCNTTKMNTALLYVWIAAIITPRPKSLMWYGYPHASGLLRQHRSKLMIHYGDVIMSTIASQITRLTIVYSTVYSDVVQRKHQSSVSLAFVRGIHRGPTNSPHKWPVTRKMFPFDDVVMLRWVNEITQNEMGKIDK